MNPEDNNHNNPNNFNFNSNQPTGNGIFGSPASNMPNGQPATYNTLNVPFASPTHFDRPIVQPQPAQLTPEELEKLNTEKTIKKFTIMSIVFGVLMIIFLGLSIWGLIFGISSDNKLTNANKTIENQAAIISAVEESSGTTINSPADVPVYKSTHGYIYIDDWGIKLKVPDDLTSVSYIFDQKYRPSICFNGLKKGVQYFPAFADIAQNTGGMGCLRRVEVAEGNADQDGRSFGTQVFSDSGFNYFYVAPGRVFSQDAAEQGLESTAVQLIKNMLSGNNISKYE